MSREAVRLRGDETALFSEHYERLVRVTQRALHGDSAHARQVAEDAVADTWVIFLRAQPRRETAFAWLRAVAFHEALRILRRERRETAVEHLDEGLVDRAAAAFGPDAPSPELVAEAREALGAVAQLPRAQRDVYALLAGGYTYAEIAAQLGLSVRQVDRRLRRAREAILEGPSRLGR